MLKVLGDFVGAINRGWSYESDTALGFDYDLDDIIESFGTMPQTSSAVALWLVKLDFLIAPHLKKVDLEKTTCVSTRTRSKGTSSLTNYAQFASYILYYIYIYILLLFIIIFF